MAGRQEGRGTTNGAYAAYPPAPPTDVTELSFFDYVQQVCHGPNPMPMHRVCTLMRKMKAKWLVEEQLAANSELAQEFGAIRRRCGVHTRCGAKRLTFFADMADGDWRDPKAKEAVLGYVVLVTLDFRFGCFPAIAPRTYMYEAVITFPGEYRRAHDGVLHKNRTMNYYYHCWNDFLTVVGTPEDHRKFRVSGGYFAQQNSLTSVCAHAAAQMAVNSMPRHTVGRRGRKLTSERINRILRIDHAAPKTQIGHFELDPRGQPTGGLSVQQVVSVAKKLRLGVIKESFVAQPDISAAAWIYAHLESCCPTILGIQRPQLGEQEQLSHVVTVLGHTRNTDRWAPEAKVGYRELTSRDYIPTSAWVCHFLINDDNFGMYRTLDTGELYHVILPAFNANIHPSMAITFVPKGVTTRGIDAEHVAHGVVRGCLAQINAHIPSLAQLRWIKALSHHRTRLTCRTFLSRAEDLIDHLTRHPDRDGHALDEQLARRARRCLPDLIWNTEISLPNLICGNRAKLGDVATPVNHAYTGIPKRDAKAIQFLWLPGIAVWGKQQRLYPWPLTSYVPLQSHCHAVSFGPQW